MSQVRSATATGGDFFVPDRAAATAGVGADCAAATAGAGAATSAAAAPVGAARSPQCNEFATAAPNPPYFSSSLQMSDMLDGCVWEVVLRFASYFLFHVNNVHQGAYYYAYQRNDGIVGIAGKLSMRQDNL